MGTIASSLSVTLENFSYNRDKEEQTKTLAELSAAKQVQLSLLPKLREYPGVTIANHLRSAQQTGGDWYSFGYDSVHNAMNFFIGDVTGHGVSAALLTGVAFGGISFGEYTVQKILPHQAPEDRLKILAQSVNTAIYKNAEYAQRLMTMALLSLDLESGELVYLNCGHNSHFLLEKNNVVRPLIGTGSRLGFAEEPLFLVKKEQLHPGDMVFLCTDGLYENAAFEHRMISSKKLKELLQGQKDPHAALEHVLEYAQAFWNSYPPDDDVTILIFQWTGPQSKDCAGRTHFSI